MTLWLPPGRAPAPASLGAGGEATTIPPPARALAAFADDIRFDSKRALVQVRAILRVTSTGCDVDLSESDACPASVPRPALRHAVVVALCEACGARLRPDLIQLTFPDLSDAASEAREPGWALHWVARVYDAVRGAGSELWPQFARAGSTSLGAVLRIGDRWHVLRGGEGASADEGGRDALCAPVVEVLDESRERPSEPSQQAPGAGLKSGGRGEAFQWTAESETTCALWLDRVHNPPHGMQQAGPPQPATAGLTGRDGTQATPSLSGQPFTVPPGTTLRVDTAGGAGYGFMGYGVEVGDWLPK